MLKINDNLNKLTITDLIIKLGSNLKDDTAIQTTDPKEKNISYENLLDLVYKTRDTFNALGYVREDKVALAIKNGPKMASMFLATASSMIACPLNPSYTKDEFVFYFKDLNIKAVIVEKNPPKPIITAAKMTNIKVLYLDNSTGKIEEKKLKKPYNKNNKIRTSQEDIALILHTSGTTSKPKMVPLTHKNLIFSAYNISKTLNLNSKDKCLNIMPLFHIHGLTAGLLACLYKKGTSIIPSSGFNALSFYKNLDTTKPTWYTAVPTMHQMILSRANRNKNIISLNPLRFIRSSSASLPESVMINLEKTFKAPVIESYGMTEASHQMTSNLLPPDKRKPSSVGLPAGPEVKIMTNKTIIDRSNKEIKGQIIIKGENVTKGYLNNKKANSENFYNDWFLTGDEGYFDKDGYLIISGRLKELINRGGEKISPLEVDEVLTSHKNVLQAVTFSIPHPKLGEDIAAVIVLKSKQEKFLDEIKIKKFCKNKLADFKIPNKIIFMNEIPKGATGKIQRIGMAKKLGIK